MKKKLMDLYKTLPLVPPDAGLREVAETMLNNKRNLIFVGKESEEPQGYITCMSVLRELINRGDRAKVTAGDIAVSIETNNIIELTKDMDTVVNLLCKRMGLPLFASENDRVTGMVSPEEVIGKLAKLHKEERQKRVNVEQIIDNMFNILPLGIALVTKDGEIKRANKLAKEIMKENLTSSDDMKAIIRNNYQKIFVSGGESYYRFFVTGGDLQDEEAMIIFVDATAEYNLVKRLENAREEAETALAIMLPDHRIEMRLKSIVEYMDEYDDETGKIKITGVIKNGVYKHVINILKLVADAFKQGLMELPGMDKNTIVSATVLHDIAKVQPTLKVGDLVNPKEVFEQGYLHAFRGASIAKGMYNVKDNVYYLIKYHHHDEKELPNDFPDFLLPMFRFFRLIDGLSAGITRRGSNVKMKVNDTRICVAEKSNFPLYNRRVEIDLYSGEYISERL
ncbi:MAG: hypothetical protein PWR10_2430 [Halanaerobiales bacterium]|nr:hypothetical protein [Halanaerobiales bacterium]